MRIDYGTIIAIVVVLLFYFRLIILQRQRTKRYRLLQEQSQKQKGNKALQAAAKAPINQQMGFHIFSWPLLIAGIAVLLVGAGMAAFYWVPVNVRSFWWVGIVVGVFLLNFSIR
jgi:hypothetical protein